MFNYLIEKLYDWLYHKEKEERHIVGNTIMWFKNGQLHRDTDQPAIISCDNGIQKWYKNGMLHRENGPAVLWSDGSCYWYLNDRLHRADDLPAETNWIGNYWWFNGMRHREDDKPAMVTFLGIQKWYKNGFLHRDGDKPAVIWSDISRPPEYWKNGIKYKPYHSVVDWRQEGF